jgi:hypothetical protein
VLLAGSATTRFVPRLARYRRLAEIAAGAGTAAAVIGHGYGEVRDSGSFDPEVLSVVYLLYSLLQGRGLSASVVTWVASFGRHLFAPAGESILLSIHTLPRRGRQAPSYEVSARAENVRPVLQSYLSLAREFVADAVSGGEIGKERLMGSLRQMNRAHNSMLEGIGKLDDAIRVSID